MNFIIHLKYLKLRRKYFFKMRCLIHQINVGTDGNPCHVCKCGTVFRLFLHLFCVTSVNYYLFSLFIFSFSLAGERPQWIAETPFGYVNDFYVGVGRSSVSESEARNVFILFPTSSSHSLRILERDEKQLPKGR